MILERSDVKLSYIVLMVFLSLISFGSSMTFVILPLYILELNPKAVYAGLLTASGSASMIISSALSGYLIDKLKKKKLLIIITALMLFPETIFFSYLNDVYQIITLRFFQGASIFACTIATQALIIQLAKHKTMGRSMGWINMVSALGRSFGNLGGGLMANYFNFKFTFLFGSFFPLIGCLLLLFIKEPQMKLDEEPKSQIPKSQRIQLNLPLFHVFLVILLCAIGDIFIFITVYFKLIGFSTEYIGIVMWIQSLGHIGFMPLSGNLCDRFGRKRILTSGIFILVIVYFFIILRDDPFYAIIGIIGVSLGWSAFSTASTTIILDYAGSTQRAKAIGLNNSIIGLGHMIGSTSMGVLSDTLQSIPLAMRLMSIATLVSFILSLKVKEIKKSTTGSSR